MTLMPAFGEDFKSGGTVIDQSLKVAIPGQRDFEFVRSEPKLDVRLGDFEVET